MTQTIRISSCACGKVKCEARGEPFLNASCYCEDCQLAGKQIEALTGAQAVCTADGGSEYMTFHQNQWKVIEGDANITSHKLSPKAPTTRYVAGCCNSALYLKNKHGFWVSTFKNRYVGDVPPLEWRHKLSKRNSDLPVPNDIPFYKGFPLRLFGRLAKAKFQK